MGVKERGIENKEYDVGGKLNERQLYLGTEGRNNLLSINNSTLSYVLHCEQSQS
jgi:hypothetical protein